MLGNLLWRIDLYVWPLTFQPVSVTWMCLQGSVRRGQDDVCVARNTQASTVTGKQLIMITSMFEHTHVPRKQCCVPCFSKQKSTCCNVPFLCSCAPGYEGYPTCVPCQCHMNGTDGEICSLEGGQPCPCKENYVGNRCDMCASGYYNFPECTRKSTFLKFAGFIAFFSWYKKCIILICVIWFWWPTFAVNFSMCLWDGHWGICWQQLWRGDWAVSMPTKLCRQGVQSVCPWLLQLPSMHLWVNDIITKAFLK